jgi:YebC/PmpR family DNA-binding regulatory protein
MAAARAGGPDPDTNLSLRYAIDEAKYANMPKDTIKRAVDKGAGAGQGDAFDSITYEGYGPGGTAVIIDTLTDNKNRTVTEIRTLFKKSGGSLGNAGTVAYMFQTKGQILVDAAKVNEEQIMDLAIEAGADDVQSPEADNEDAGFWTVLTQATDFQQVKVAIEEAGIEITEASIAKIPDDTVAVAGDEARKVYNLIESIEDNDDVQNVYTNADIDPSALED